MFHRKARAHKVMSVFMVIMLVATCNSATLQPAFAQMSKTATEQAANPAIDLREGTSGEQSAPDAGGEPYDPNTVPKQDDSLVADDSNGGDAAGNEGAAGSENAAGSEGSLGGDTPSDTLCIPDTKPAPEALQGTLSVLVAFEHEVPAEGSSASGAMPTDSQPADGTLPDAAPSAASVLLQPQTQTRLWDATTQTWGAWTEKWEALGEPVLLTADDIAQAQRAGTAAYRFENLPVQTVIAPNAYSTPNADADFTQLESQVRYRAIETKVDNREVVYITAKENVLLGTVAALASADPSQATDAPQVSDSPQVTDNSSRTPPSSASIAYTIEVSDLAALSAETLEGTADVSALADARTTIKNVVIVAPVAPDVPEMASRAPGDANLLTVYNKTFNNDGNYTYTLDEAAWVTRYDSKGGVLGTPSKLAAGAAITVPAGGWFTIDPSKASLLGGDVVATLSAWPNKDGDPAPVVMPTSHAVTLNNSAPAHTFVTQKPIGSLTLSKTWNDNQDQYKNRPTSDAFAALLSLEYTVDGGTTWLTVGEHLADLGYDVSPAIPAANTTNFATWDYVFANTLNHLDKEGREVTHRLAEKTDDPLLANYVATYVDKAGVSVLMNTVKNPYEATKKWADSDNDYGTRWDDAAAWLGKATLYRTTPGKAPEKVEQSGDKGAEGYVNIVIDNGDPSTWTIIVPNALGFDASGMPYTYYLVENVDEAGKFPVAEGAQPPYDTSWYAPVYVNVGNHASNTAGLYLGGTLTNTLTDNFVFTGTKVWADDGLQATRDARPDCTWVLYRYPKDGVHSYETASPVETPSVTLDQKNNDGETVTFPVASVDGSAATPLPRYDVEGHEYIYYVKELTNGGTASYVQQFSDNGSEQGNDKLLFNNGTLTNLRVGSTSLNGTKQWIAAARADLKSEVDMSLTRKKVVCNEAGHPVDEQGVETDDPSTYAYTPDLNEDKTSWSKTETLTNFSAEFMSQTASFGGLAQYDERGLPYRYNISETGVRTKIGEEYQPVDLEKAEGHFVTQDGYRYRQVTEVQDDGSILVKNILVGNAEVNITKTFPDGIVGGTTTITYGIYQDGVKIGTVTKVYTDESGKGDYTYNADAPDHSVNKYVSSDRGTDVLVSTYSQLGDRPDPVPSEGLLPRYDSKDGHEYQYTITEDAVNPPAYEKDNEISFSQNDSVYTDANPDYKDEHYLRVQAGVSNPVVGPGGESILVKKAWIDDFDMACRQSVVVGLVDSTGAVVEYGADEGDKAGKQAIGTISPSQDRVRIAVPKRLKAADLTVRELTVGESSVVQSGNSPLTDVDWIKNHPGFVAGHGWVMTTQHEYDVSVKNPTDSKDSDGAWVVTNRRIGVLEIDITKKWVDGSDVQGKRPGELTFTISNDENKNPFVGADGNPTNSLDVTLTKDGNAVDGDSNTWAAIEGLLLKYDKIDGSILHYTIEEKTDWIATSGADYVMSKQHDGYFIGDVHTNDKDKYTFTNALAKSVVPTINKFWKDDNAPTVTRPDLVPVLYEQFEKAVPGSNPTTVTRQITNYVDRDWDTQTKPGKQWWQCTFASLPKYTGEGYEISYFVGETVAVPGDFSYQAFYPEVPSERGSFAENSGSRLKDNLKLTDEAGVENGTTVSAAPLGGTIVNKLEANRTLSGLKIWKGMPEGLGAQWYPTVKFGLYKASDAPNPDSPVDPAKALDHVTLEKGATAFAFAKPVPKYDTEGKMIEYVVREEAPENIGVFYDITSDTTVGYQITNTFLTDQNYTINFDKTWEDVPSGLKDKQLPSVTLTLVRYMKNALTGIDDPTTKVTLTDTAITLAYDGTTVKQAASWKELPYYAPNGKPYTYQVEESSLNGYNKLGPIDVMGTYDDDAKIGAGAARATNTYNGGRSIGFTLEKKWSGDSAYDLNQRPASVQLELHRKTPGTTPAFDEQVTKPLELNAADTWQHTVAESDLVDSIDPKLVEYASNGEAYTYYLKELSTEGYMVTSTEVKPAADDKETSFSLVATNTVKTQSLKAVKAWQKTVGGVSTSLTGDEMLFAYQLGALPSSITYNVEYSVDAGASWKQLCKKGTTDVITMTSNVQNPNTASISYTSPELKNLPTTVLSGNTSSPVQYRAVEASAVIEGATVLRTGSAGAVTMGTFGVSEASVSKGAPVTATATTTTNALPMKQLDITKVWDDETNRDGVRPSTLTFDVTRTKCNTDTDKATASVVVGWEKNGVEGEPNTWKKSMFVPVYWNPNTTTPSEYAISESLDADKFVNVDKYPTRWVSIDGTTWTEVTNTPPTTPTVDLSSTGSAAFFKNSRAHDVTTITASKEWAAFDSKADMGSLVDLSGTSYRPATLTFELQYSVDGGTTWFAVDATGEDGSPKPENPKTSGGLAIDAKITPTVNADGTLTTNPAWSDLPKYQNNDTVDDSESYQYRVMESSLAEGVSQTPAFTVSYAPPSLNGKDITADSNPVTVTNTFKTTSFTATKTWDDSSNLYETRPDAVKFTLQYSVDQGTNWINVPDAGIWANKATFNMTNPATDTGTWTATVDMLPECAVDGTAYKYRAVETALIYGVGANATEIAFNKDSAYTSSGDVVHGGTLANTVVSAKGIAATKSWDDNSNQDGKRPASIEVTLQKRTAGSLDDAAWVDVETKTLNEGNSWTYTWPNVAKFSFDSAAKKLVEQEYRATEKAVPDGYSKTESESTLETAGKVATTFTIANTYTPKKMAVTAEKTWDDQANFFSTRPTELTFTLQYQVAGSEWKDADDALLKGIKAERTVGVDKDGTLTGEGTKDGKLVWENLLVNMNAAGTATEAGETENIAYHVVETATKGYTTSYASDGTTFGSDPVAVKGDVTQDSNDRTVTVKNTMNTTQLTGKKTWEDQGNTFGLRPFKADYRATVKLYLSNGTTETEVDAKRATWTWDMTELNVWTYTITNLPILLDGYSYVVKEIVPAAYTEANEGTATTTLDGAAYVATGLTNTLQTGNLSVSKTWADDNNRDGKRPAGLEVILSAKANDQEYKVPGRTGPNNAITLTPEAWSYTWENLPCKTAAGHIITYTVTEDKVREYTATVQVGEDAPQNTAPASSTLTKDSEITIGFTNTHTPEVVAKEISKMWDDNSNKYGTRPSSLLVTLYGSYKGADGNPVKEQMGQQTFSGQTGNTWKYTFKNLPKYKAGFVGVEITYSVEEEAVEGYSLTSVDGNLLNMINKINTTKLTGAKIWVDQSDAYGLRPAALDYPASVKLYLNYEDGREQKQIDDATWSWTTEGDTWTYEVSGIPVPVKGTFYTVVESPLIGYTEASGGTVAAHSAEGSAVLLAGDFTNTLNTTSLAVVKTWSDANDAALLRPDSLTIQIQQSTDGVTWNDLKLASDTPITIKLDGSETPTAWQGTVDKLPSTSPDNKPYQYRAVEVSATKAGQDITRVEDTLGAYDVEEETAGTVTTITNTLQTGNLSVAKMWVDDNNRDGKRPADLKVTLSATANGVDFTVPDKTGDINAITLTPETWSHTWENLPCKTAAGDTITYTVTEADVSEYTATAQVGTGEPGEALSASSALTKGGEVTIGFTNICESKKMAVAAAKTWDDQANFFSTRPANLTFTLQYQVTGAAEWKDADDALLKGIIAKRTVGVDKTSGTLTGEGTKDGKLVWENLPVNMNTAGTATEAGETKNITYRVVETAAEGYATSYASDGTTFAPVPATVNGNVKLDANDKTITVKNTMSTTQVSVEKTWIDDQNAGDTRKSTSVQLQLSTDAGATWTDWPGKAQSLDLTVASTETLTFKDLPVTTVIEGQLVTFQYRVVETVLGHYLTTIGDAVVAVKDATETIAITNEQNVFSFEKFDEKGIALAGATFTLEGAFSDGEVFKTILSGATSETLKGLLLAGEAYVLQEGIAPAGQKLISEAIVFTCNADGTLTLDEAAPDLVALSEDNTKISITDPPIAVTFKKTDRDTGEVLQNCFFDLTGEFVGDPEGTQRTIHGTAEQLTEMTRGMLYASALVQPLRSTFGEMDQAGMYVYTMKEVAEPNGYQIEPKAVNFMVDSQGVIHILNDDGTITKTADGGTTLQFSDPATLVNFTKTNADGKPLDGATLRIAGTFADGSTEQLVKPTATGAARLEALLISKASYTITEHVTPEGYVALKEPIVFSIDSVNTITLQSNAENLASVSPDGKTITIKNNAAVSTKGGTKLQKTGDPLSGLGVLGGWCMVAIATLGSATCLARRRRRG